MAPRMLKMSPRSQMIMKVRESPSADERRKFSIICGEKTTTQQAMDMEPHMPLRATISMPLEGDIVAG